MHVKYFKELCEIQNTFINGLYPESGSLDPLNTKLTVTNEYFELNEDYEYNMFDRSGQINARADLKALTYIIAQSENGKNYPEELGEITISDCDRQALISLQRHIHSHCRCKLQSKYSMQEEASMHKYHNQIIAIDTYVQRKFSHHEFFDKCETVKPQ